jgi:hypothetical protein
MDQQEWAELLRHAQLATPGVSSLPISSPVALEAKVARTRALVMTKLDEAVFWYGELHRLIEG